MSKALKPLPSDFATRLVRWQRQHGRHDLPWQNTRDPYRVWLSEVMLQQTQVSTVLGYYDRFLNRFPDVKALAAAHTDEVLALWSGLGYYSRARHLHRCAQVVVTEHGGQFPLQAQTLQTLPGIGRSTAAAVASLCHEERIAILDGNVKRVLTRLLGFDQDLAQSPAEQALWTLAQELLPTRAKDMPAYTQGVMDLGATVCTRSKPRCGDCPVREICVGHGMGRPEQFPVKTRKLKRSTQSWWWLLAFNPASEVLLLQRPARGIWASLHCLPMFDSEDALRAVLPSSALITAQVRPAIQHTLTHRDLFLHTVEVELSARQAQGVARVTESRWCGAAELSALGLPAPVRVLLKEAARRRAHDAGAG